MRRLRLKFETSALTIFFLALLVGCLATAGTIKTWATSDTLTAADLNANFQHIHNLMVGGHGARLVDADVSASAAISTSKLAAYRYVPVAWGYTTTVCSSGTCPTVGAGFSSVTYDSATGQYKVNWASARTNANYAILTTPQTQGFCVPTAVGTTSFTVNCYNGAGAATNFQFNFAVFDDD